MSDIFIRLSKTKAIERLDDLADQHKDTFIKSGSIDFTARISVSNAPTGTGEKTFHFRVNAASSENGKEVTFIARSIPPQKFPSIENWSFRELEEAIKEAEKEERLSLIVSIPPLFFLQKDDKAWGLRPGLTLVFGATGSGKNHLADRLARGQMLKLDGPKATFEKKDKHYLRYGDPIEGSLYPSSIIKPDRTGVGFDHGQVGDVLLETNRYRPDDLEDLSSFVADALRQKADVVTISELRKKEDFCDALVLAATDHRVVATGHAKDMDSAILRLFEMFECLEPSAKRTPLVSALNTILHIEGQKLNAFKAKVKDQNDPIEVKMKILRPTACFVDNETRSHLTARKAGQFYPVTAGPVPTTNRGDISLVDQNGGFRTPEDFYLRRFAETWAVTLMSIIILIGKKKIESFESQTFDVATMNACPDYVRQAIPDSPTAFEDGFTKLKSFYHDAIRKVVVATIKRANEMKGSYRTYESFSDRLELERNLRSRLRFALYHRLLDEIDWDILENKWIIELPMGQPQLEDTLVNSIYAIEDFFARHAGESILFGGKS